MGTPTDSDNVVAEVGKPRAERRADAAVQQKKMLLGRLRLPAVLCRSSVTAVCWSRNGRLLVSGSQDAAVVFWDVLSGRQLARTQVRAGDVCSDLWAFLC